MDQRKLQQEEPQGERRFSQEQYDMLKRCSKKKDMTEWNQWLKNNREQDVFLQGANLRRAHLEGADLVGAQLEGATLGGAHLEGANLMGAQLEGANLTGAHLEAAGLMGAQLEGAKLVGAQLEGADLGGAQLEGANLTGAHLKGADLTRAHLEGADLGLTHLEGARLVEAHLEGAKLWEAHLEGADLTRANLKGAHLTVANLESAKCQWAVVDGSTLLAGCTADRKTDFLGVGLDNARIDPGLKQLLEYNIRRNNWERWYKDHSLTNWVVRRFWSESTYGKSNSFWKRPARWWRSLSDSCERRSFFKRVLGWLRSAADHIKRSPLSKSPVWWFWTISDYGLSTARIIAVFFALAILFAAAYWIWGLVAPPGIVENLLVGRNGVEVPSALVPFRALYFSVVTMTTLGFGDMHAYAASFWGHLLLMVQVLLGYVLLAALVTRFAILFTAGGPAGKFSKPEKKPNDEHRGESK